MSDKRITLDTNILIYAVDRDAGLKHEIARSLIEKAMLMDCVLTVQALAEFYTAATRKKYASHEEVVMFIEDWSKIFPVIGTGGNVLMRALSVVEQDNLSFWDAMIWSAAKEAGCTMWISEDFQDGRTLGGILIRNPFSEIYMKKKEMEHIFK